MAVLVVAEQGSPFKVATLHAVTAGAALGGELHVLVAGKECAAVAEAAAKVAGVTKVLVADSAE